MTLSELQNQSGNAEAQPVGLFYVWERGMPIPSLPTLSDFHVRQTGDSQLLVRLSDIGIEEIEKRVRSGHVPYIGYLNGEPAGYGWSAWHQVDIGELGISFTLPEGNRYLWDFVTRPAWRGQGIYTHLIQHILTTEGKQAERFWIGHDLGNVPSGKGILRAGFRVVGGVWIQDGQPVFRADNGREHAESAASLLQLPLVGDF